MTSSAPRKLHGNIFRKTETRSGDLGRRCFRVQCVKKGWPLTYVTGIKFKVENKGQYAEYLQELEPIREELGIPLKEVLYPDEK